MIELMLNTSKRDNFIFIDKESGFALTRLNLRGVVSCITPSLQRAIDSETLIITKDYRNVETVEEKVVDEATVVEEPKVENTEEVKAKRKPRTKK